MQKKILGLCLCGFLIAARPTHAQLDQTFKNIFDQVLISGFQATGTGAHQGHFIPVATQIASLRLTPALNSLIARNVSSFPLSSTSAGVTFDLSSGQPVSISESLGPIFAETAPTLGKGKINVGLNYTYLNLAKLRGLSTQDIRFTFTHQDVGPAGLGDSVNESDFVDLFLGLDVNASIVAAFGTLGLTNNLDIGVAVPFINLSLSGEATAVINSFTFANSGKANHRFNADSLNPQLFKRVTYPSDASASGLGDIALRVKYSFLRGADVDLAALLDIRFPTGDKKDFLGTGKTNTRLAWIMSKKIGDFSPHLNLGYNRRSADLDSDQLGLTIGFDQKVATGVTFAAGFMGEFDLKKSEAIKFFSEPIAIINEVNATTKARYARQVDLSNVAERDQDNTLNVALGFRAAPSERLLLLGNIIVPLNDAGLRSSVAPTFGATLSF